MMGMSYLPLVYSIVAAWLYSNEQLFKNKVLANKSHQWFNAPSGHSYFNHFEELLPGTIFTVCTWLGFIKIAFFVIYRCFRKRSCLKTCPRPGHSKYWDFDSLITQKHCNSFYEVLSNR